MQQESIPCRYVKVKGYVEQGRCGVVGAPAALPARYAGADCQRQV
jgi:hypothetical protein